MDQQQTEFAQVVALATRNQTVLRMTYMNAQGVVSTRRILPCSPFVENPDGTLNFNAWDVVESTTAMGRRRPTGVSTFRIDGIIAIEEAGVQRAGQGTQQDWLRRLRANNGGTVLFPSPETPLFRGKFPQPFVAPDGALEKLLAHGWVKAPVMGLRRKA